MLARTRCVASSNRAYAVPAILTTSVRPTLFTLLFKEGRALARGGSQIHAFGIAGQRTEVRFTFRHSLARRACMTKIRWVGIAVALYPPYDYVLDHVRWCAGFSVGNHAFGIAGQRTEVRSTLASPTTKQRTDGQE